MVSAALAAALLQSLSPVAATGPGRQAVLCLDPLGVNLGATCQSFDASLLGRRPDICQCENAGLRVTAPYCTGAERPQAQTADYDRARYAAARADRTLVGKRWRGRSFCVAP